MFLYSIEKHKDMYHIPYDMNKYHEIEDRYMPLAFKALEEKGFTDMVRMPQGTLYDIEAKLDGETVYVEVRSRSPDKAPLFAFKRRKLERLEELGRTTGRKVFILLVWGKYHQLFELHEFWKVVKPFKVYITGRETSKRLTMWRLRIKGEMTDDEKRRIEELYKKGYTQEAVAMAVGRSVETVRKYLKSKNLVRPQPPSKPKAERQLRLEIRIRDEMVDEVLSMWRELLYEYKKKGLRAEDLLRDALRCALERGLPRTGRVH